MFRTVSSLNPASNGLRRHTLVWLKESPQPDLDSDLFWVNQWQQRGLPFVVSRHRGEPHCLSLGFCSASETLPLPRRIAVSARPETIRQLERPPTLATVVDNRSTASLAPLSNAALAAGLNFRVFGSWMWQTLTGDSHVKPTSDLDLLIEVATEAEADRATKFLQTAAAEYPLKIDGELSLPIGEVHWREYLGNGSEILVKSVATVRMIRRAELWQ